MRKRPTRSNTLSGIYERQKKIIISNPIVIAYDGKPLLKAARKAKFTHSSSR
jgi:hypothetical protein